jgi:hypothetical protein
VGQFHKFQAGDGAQEFARGVADFLSVEEMAGVLIGDAQSQWLQRMQRGGEAQAGEEFGYVADFGAKRNGLLVFGFFWQKEMIVFFQRGAAARGVGDDGVEPFALEGGEVLAGEGTSGVADASMSGQRAATQLAAGDGDFATVGGKDADGGLVEAREGDLGDAAGEESDAGTARADGGKRAAELVEEKRIVDAGKKALAFGEAKQSEYAGCARERLQPGALIKPKNTREGSNATGVGKQTAKDQPARQTGEEGALVVALDDGAGVLDELAVLDCGRTHGFAGTAVEAFVNVIDKGSGDGAPALCGDGSGSGRAARRISGAVSGEIGSGDMNHLVDAAAGRVGLEIPEAVGRAGVEAEAAVNAAGVVFVDRDLAGDGLSGSHGRGPVADETRTSDTGQGEQQHPAAMPALPVRGVRG